MIFERSRAIELLEGKQVHGVRLLTQSSAEHEKIIGHSNGYISVQQALDVLRRYPSSECGGNKSRVKWIRPLGAGIPAPPSLPQPIAVAVGRPSFSVGPVEPPKPLTGLANIDEWNRAVGANPRGKFPLAAAEPRHRAERRRREQDAVGCHAEAEWQEILERYGRRCLRCGIHESHTVLGRLTRDHVVPLDAGGTDYASNLQPLCQRCNSWKCNREIDFRQSVV